MNTLILSASMAVLVMGLAGCASTVPASAAPAAPAAVSGPALSERASLTLTISNVRVGAGPLMVALFDSPSSWSGSARAVRDQRVQATSANVTITFQDLPAGAYGVKLFQDVNSDGTLGVNPFGIPNEPFGFSNNAAVRFGPPSFEAAQFMITAPATTHTIALPQ